MANNKTYAVFGLGRYGSAVAKELVNNGAEVLAVDIDEEKVNDAVADIPLCKCADVTDPEVLKQLGVANIDVVVISMATDLEASVMATMLCKEMGVKTVISKCSSEMNCKILSKVGADRVIFPESESGIRLAKNLVSSGFVDILDISNDVSMVELEVRPEWENKSLLELDLRKKYSINIVSVIEDGKASVIIDPEKPLKKSMRLIVIADTAKLRKLK
ncbi:MAG: TrkA family potassium uptake protein [Clostridia bacterium]|nr:TrkA family potassium uptake protein [Clostridia bacterium]